MENLKKQDRVEDGKNLVTTTHKILNSGYLIQLIALQEQFTTLITACLWMNNLCKITKEKQKGNVTVGVWLEKTRNINNKNTKFFPLLPLVQTWKTVYLVNSWTFI